MSVHNSAQTIVALLPGGYFLTTRILAFRDFFFLFVTQLLPSIWLSWRLGDSSQIDTLSAFLASYLAFLSVYELGYLLNDTWDARRNSDGRARLRFRLNLLTLICFISFRVVAWFFIAQYFDWFSNVSLIAGYVLLILVFSLHNFVQSAALRLATFFSLATLRFSIPIAALVADESLTYVVTIAAILYAFPRFLTYAESKGRLQIPERKSPHFGFSLYLLLGPAALFASFNREETAITEVWLWLVFAYFIWLLASAGGEKRKIREGQGKSI